MRIVLISMVFPHPRRGIFPGIERHVFEYSRALAKRGVDVRIVTSFWNGGTAREEYEGLEIHRVEDSGTRYGKAGRLFAQHVRSFGKSLRARPELFGDAGVVQTFIALPSVACIDSSRAPMISTFYHRDKPSRLLEYLTLPSLFAMEKRFFRESSLVVTFSDSSRRVLMSEYGLDERAIAVTPLGVDMDKFHPATPPPPREAGGPFRMLFVGPLIERKGLHHLIEALARVNERRRDWVLILVGGGRERAALAARASQLGFGDRIDFRGYIDGWGDELPEIYRQADLFVFPSLKEGFGMAIAEAMACGTPVLTTRASAIPEVVGDAGILVEPAEPRGLAAEIIRLMEDDGLRRSLAAAGARRVREMFSWDVVVDRTLEVFQRVARGEPAEGGGR